MQHAEARLASLFRRFDNIESVLDGYSNVSHTMTEGGRVLKDQAVQLLAEARRSLIYRWSRLEPLADDEREVLRRTLCSDFAAVLVELSATLLPALDGTRSNGVPIELEPVLARLASRASVGAGARIVLYASEQLNYSIERHDDPLTSLAPRMASPPNASAAPAGEPFLFLRIPRIERDSGTLHAVIAGHELGHLRDWNHHLSDIKPPIMVPSEWLDQTNSIKLEKLDDWARFQSVAMRWSAEIVADIVAALTFGPASLQALSELVGTLGGWGIDAESHPGTDRRAALILDLLSREGFAQVGDVGGLMSHFAAETSAALARPVDIDGSPFPDADRAAWGLVHMKLPELEAACRAAIEDDELFDASDWPLVSEAMRRFTLGQPSGEYFDQSGDLVPQRDAVILNAAYAVRTTSLDVLGSILGLDVRDPSDVSSASAVLDGLVLKSFEVAEFRRRTPWA